MDLANWALRTSPKFAQGLNISSIRVFDQNRDPEIPINLRPHVQYRLCRLYFSDIKANPFGYIIMEFYQFH